MKLKIQWLLFIIISLAPVLVRSQSTMEFQAGTTIEVTSGADICADNIIINGTYSGSGTKCGGALPVDLSSFTASVNEDVVTLKWETATEVNNNGFEVQRASGNQQKDNGSWQKIGFVSGSGNSNSPNSYSFSDQPQGGTSFSYRLKQIDNDGNYKYYDAITVTLNNPKTAELMQNSPNPFNPSTAIKFYIPNNSDVSIKIYDMLGRKVATLINNQEKAGYHIVYWNGRDRYGNNASSGVYIYRLTAGNFSETKKMMLMK